MTVQAIVIAENEDGKFYLEHYEEANCLVCFGPDKDYHGTVFAWSSSSSPNRTEALRMSLAEAEAFVDRHYDECRQFGTYLRYCAVF
jgi:uncharacterized protein YciI